MTPEDPKKSETIEVRVPWRLKQDFMARARREGRSASEVIRDMMQDYVRRPAQRTTTQTLETAMTVIRKNPRRAGLAAILGAAGTSALLAGAIPAGAAPDLRAQFERMDRDGDGVVSLEEMAPGTGAQEFRMERRTGDGDAAAEPLTETVGPVLLPATGPNGERGVRMTQVTRRIGPDDGELPGDMALPTPLRDEFQGGDTNGDGVLTFDEFEARYSDLRTRSFDALDGDGDGILSAAEIDGNPIDGQDGGMAAAALRGADSDGDGSLTRAEYEDAV